MNFENAFTTDYKPISNQHAKSVTKYADGTEEVVTRHFITGFATLTDVDVKLEALIGEAKDVNEEIRYKNVGSDKDGKWFLDVDFKTKKEETADAAQ